MPEPPAPPTPTAAVVADSRPAPSRGTTRVRIDEGSAGGGHDLPPGRGSLLRAFCGWRGRPRPAAAPVPPEERRAEPRHDRVECQAWVGWKTRRRFRMNDALVINLSRSGAQVFLDTLPPTGGAGDLWLFLETPGQNAVVKAHVLEVIATGKGQCAVRVSFREPCPFAFFEAAVCGLAPVNPRARVPKPAHALARGPRSSAIPSR